ncbi:hypothetical protein BDW74DRAFT_175897 [Aspergillus multicolor]|uniref:uncharacterized protein n=1 Tax=Aspergillus multicolor TaxID=41759 RepID=UPI003CCE391D
MSESDTCTITLPLTGTLLSHTPSFGPAVIPIRLDNTCLFALTSEVKHALVKGELMSQDAKVVLEAEDVVVYVRPRQCDRINRGVLVNMQPGEKVRRLSVLSVTYRVYGRNVFVFGVDVAD